MEVSGWLRQNNILLFGYLLSLLIVYPAYHSSATDWAHPAVLARFFKADQPSKTSQFTSWTLITRAAKRLAHMYFEVKQRSLDISKQSCQH